MVINGVELLRAKPILAMAPSKKNKDGVSYGLAEVGYDIRIKQDVYFWPKTLEMVGPEINIQAPGERFGQSSDGNFVLASAIEEFNMPKHLMGIVHDKSTWARKGVSVFNTVIEPGWRGFLTLELVFHGNEELHIPAGTGIAQVIFHQIACPAQYQGKYQDQANEPVSASFA
jgi:dCTP deaminase